MAANDIETSISVDLSSFNRSMDKAIKQASTLDSALDDISATKITPLVDISAGNLDEIRKGIQSLDGTYTTDLKVDDAALRQAQRLLDDIDAQSASLKITADDSQLKAAQAKIDDIDSAAPDVKVNADDSELAGIKSQLEDLRSLAVIDLAINLAEKIPTPEEIPILGAILEADQAARRLEASLGAAFNPELARIAKEIYQDNFSGSQVEAAQSLATVVQQTADNFGNAAITGEDFKRVTELAFTAAEVSGNDFNEVLRTADTLVKSGVTPTYEEAFDVITTGFQTGADKSGDLLDSLNEYAVQFETLGIDGPHALDLINKGLESGAFNTDKVVDVFKEWNIRLQEAIADAGSTPGKVYEKLGLTDELAAYQAGEISGAELARGVTDAVKTGLAEGTITNQDVFDIFGSQAEDLTIPVTLDLVGSTGQPIDQEIAGATERAGAALYGGLTSSFETTKRLIETELPASIDEAFDIQGKIEAFNTGIKEFNALVASGEDIPAAIEKAFNLQGFAETFARFESAIGNLVIEVSSLIASVLEATGNTGGAAGIREGVQTMAAQQLAFDLKLQDDGQGIQSAVATALRRGVDEAGLEEALTTAGTELISSGDLVKAKEFTDALREVSTFTLSPAMTDYLSGKGIDPTNLTAVKTELQSIIDSGGKFFQSPVAGMGGLDFQNLLGDVSTAAAAQEAAQPIIDDYKSALSTGFETMFSEGQFLKGAITAFGLGETDTAGIFTSEIQTQLEGIPDAITEGLANLGEMDVPLFDAITAKTDEVGSKIDEVMPGVGESITTNGVQTFDAFTSSVTQAALNMTTQVPIINDQASQMTASLQDTSNAELEFTNTTEGLNLISLSPLEAVFASLRASAEDQLGYINQQIGLLQGSLQGLANFSIDIPGISGKSGGGHMYGGVIPGGTVGRVHGNEIFAAAPEGVDISVLNSQTSSVVENMIAALSGGGGMGGNTSNVTYNNQFNYNIQSNAQGYMSEGAAAAARGF